MAQITITGRLTADPELAFTNSGVARLTFTVAENERKRGEDGEWHDGETSFWRITVWRRLAEAIAEDPSLTKGKQVVITGTAKIRSYETREGEKRQGVEVTAQNVGAVPGGAAKKPSGENAQRANNTPAPASEATFDEEPPF